MNYERLFAFVAFAEHLNFTRAAERLHISQPALHVQIRKLGEEVGCRLYRREGRALVLTPEGRHLAAFGREAQERSRVVLEELRAESLPGPVVLASGAGAFQYLLGPAMRRFPKAMGPLRALTLAGPEAIEAVRAARAHIAVAAVDEPPADLTTTPLRTVGQVVVVPGGHRLAKRRAVRPRDLDGETLVVAPAGSPHRTLLAQALQLGGAQWSVGVEASGWELMLLFARCGVGLAVVNDFCPAPSGTVAIPLSDLPQATYHLIRRPGFTSRGTEALSRLIVDTLR